MTVIMAYCHTCDRGMASMAPDVSEQWAKDHVTKAVIHAKSHIVDLIAVNVEERVHVARELAR